ncbi:hypothetical protein [Thermus brockianus]|uniref:hypothetical protein n=1 Tax=Thermus brockianus TaxID=56956 RepID=UPI003B83A021
MGAFQCLEASRAVGERRCFGLSVFTALFGDPDKKVGYTPLDARVRFQAVQNGEVDVAFRNTTVTGS